MFSWGHFYMTHNARAIEPIGEAVSNSELFRRLAKAMDFDDPFFYRDDEQIMQDSMLWDNPALAGITMEKLRATGYMRLNMPSPAAYAPHAEGNFPTPSGKVELQASMAAGGNFVLPVFRQGSNDHQDGGPVDALPTYHARHESATKTPELAARFPLSMMSPKSHAFINSNYPNIKRQFAHQGEQFVMISPHDAARRGIGHNAVVKVHNARGAFTAVARVTDDAMPGVVVAPLGYWVDKTRSHATPAALNPTAFADLGRAPTFSDNLVEVSLA